jgi:hypothetical protein
MKLEELFVQHPPKDLNSTQYFIRLTASGVPQLIRVEPLFNDDSELIPSHVQVYVDDSEAPQLMDRAVLHAHTDTSTHFPLNAVLNWKQHLVH